MSDKKVYAPYIRVLLETASHFCEDHGQHRAAVKIIPSYDSKKKQFELNLLFDAGGGHRQTLHPKEVSVTDEQVLVCLSSLEPSSSKVSFVPDNVIPFEELIPRGAKKKKRLIMLDSYTSNYNTNPKP